jgi:hypothetical protein
MKRTSEPASYFNFDSDRGQAFVLPAKPGLKGGGKLTAEAASASAESKGMRPAASSVHMYVHRLAAGSDSSSMTSDDSEDEDHSSEASDYSNHAERVTTARIEAAITRPHGIVIKSVYRKPQQPVAVFVPSEPRPNGAIEQAVAAAYSRENATEAHMKTAARIADAVISSGLEATLLQSVADLSRFPESDVDGSSTVVGSVLHPSTTIVKISTPRVPHDHVGPRKSVMGNMAGAMSAFFLGGTKPAPATTAPLEDIAEEELATEHHEVSKSKIQQAVEIATAIIPQTESTREDTPLVAVDQDGPVDLAKPGCLRRCELRVFPPYAGWVQYTLLHICDPLAVLVELPIFGMFFGACILANAVVLAMDTYDLDSNTASSLATANIVFVVVFAVELVIKVFAYGLSGYCQDSFRIFDGLIVLISIIDILPLYDGTYGLSVIRLSRTLRVVRLAAKWQSMKTIIAVLAQTLPSFGWTALLLGLFWFIFSILGLQLFGNVYGDEPLPDSNFSSLNNSLLSVFQLLVGEAMDSMIYAHIALTSGAAFLFFFVWILIGQYILLNLVLALLLAGFDAADPLMKSLEHKDLLKTAALLVQDAMEQLARKEKGGSIKSKRLFASAALGIATTKTAKSNQQSVKDVFRLTPTLTPSPTSVNPLALTSFRGSAAIGLRSDTLDPIRFSSVPPYAAQATFGAVATRASPSTQESSQRSIASQARAPSRQQSNADNSQRSLSAQARAGTRLRSKASIAVAAKSLVDMLHAAVQHPQTSRAETPAEHQLFVTHSVASPPPTSQQVDLHGDDELEHALQQLGTPAEPSKSPIPGVLDAELSSDDDSLHLCGRDLKRDVACGIFVNHHPWRQLAARVVSGECPLFWVPTNHLLCSLRWRTQSTPSQSRRQWKPITFQRIVMVCIVLSSILMAVDGPQIENDAALQVALQVLEALFLMVFVLEMACKVVASGFMFHKTAYLRDGYNVLDFVVVVASVISLLASSTSSGEGVGFLRACRILRTLRPLRLLASNVSMRHVIDALYLSSGPIFNILGVLLMFWTIFAIAGVQLFSGAMADCNDPDFPPNTDLQLCTGYFIDSNGANVTRMPVTPQQNFDTYPQAMLHLFICTTGMFMTLHTFASHVCSNHDVTLQAKTGPTLCTGLVPLPSQVIRRYRTTRGSSATTMSFSYQCVFSLA